jgi:CHC2 zinc finger
MIRFDEIKSRVTIRDILTDCGFQPRGHRMPCPIHGGKNPTSFSYTDDSFYCFSCGAKGGLLDLTETLLGKNRQDALRFLAEKASMQWRDTPGKMESNDSRIFPSKTVDADLLELEVTMKGLEVLREHYTWQLRHARKCLREGRIDLSTYYITIQCHEYFLEELDSEVIKTKYEISMKKKSLHNAVKRSC